MDGEQPTIGYRITFDNGERIDFAVFLDPDSLDLLRAGQGDKRKWTELGFHRCPNCDLEGPSHCPVAVNLQDLIDFVKDLSSYEEVTVEVVTSQRTYSARAALQHVVGSLMGIYMVSSGCPILNKMRPMVETHLPFASWEETVYRAVTMYIFAQYFRRKNGQSHNWELDGLVDYYNQVQAVNNAFAERLRAIPDLHGDVSLNAVSTLSGLASIASLSIEDNDLTHWERIFMDHWGD